MCASILTRRLLVLSQIINKIPQNDHFSNKVMRYPLKENLKQESNVVACHFLLNINVTATPRDQTWASPRVDIVPRSFETNTR